MEFPTSHFDEMELDDLSVKSVVEQLLQKVSHLELKIQRLEIDQKFSSHEILKLKCENQKHKKQEGDYPFSSWKEFSEALLFYWSCPHEKSEIFPFFIESCDTTSDFDFQVIEEMLKNDFDVQEGLQIFIETLAKCHRYGHELCQSYDHTNSHALSIILLFRLYGAQEPNIDFLFPSVFESFEDETASYRVRGSLLDEIMKAFPATDTRKYADWTKIEATSWQDLLDLAKDDDRELFFRAFKYESKYLQKLT